MDVDILSRKSETIQNNLSVLKVLNIETGLYCTAPLQAGYNNGTAVRLGISLGGISVYPTRQVPLVAKHCITGATLLQSSRITGLKGYQYKA